MNARTIPLIPVTVDGRAVQAPAGQSLLHLARDLGIEIPHLCHSDGLRPDGNCRACVVEIEGERSLAPSCCRSVREGMVVHTDSPRARKSRAMVLEMLLADMPEQGHKWLDDQPEHPHGELSAWARPGTRYVAPGHGGPARRLHPVQPLPARLPRAAGQRRDRHGASRRAHPGGL